MNIIESFRVVLHAGTENLPALANKIPNPGAVLSRIVFSPPEQENWDDDRIRKIAEHPMLVVECADREALLTMAEHSFTVRLADSTCAAREPAS